MVQRGRAERKFWVKSTALGVRSLGLYCLWPSHYLEQVTILPWTLVSHEKFNMRVWTVLCLGSFPTLAFFESIKILHVEFISTTHFSPQWILSSFYLHCVFRLGWMKHQTQIISRYCCINCFYLAQIPQASAEGLGRRVKWCGWPRINAPKLESGLSGITTGTLPLSWRVTTISTFKTTPVSVSTYFLCPGIHMSALHPFLHFCLVLLLSLPSTPLPPSTPNGHNRHHTCSSAWSTTGKRQGLIQRRQEGGEGLCRGPQVSAKDMCSCHRYWTQAGRQTEQTDPLRKPARNT